VLDRRRDDVIALSAQRLGGTTDRQRVRLGGPAREDDLASLGPEQRRHPVARLVDRRLRRPTERVRAAGGLPKCWLKNGSIASRTRGSTGVVA
jgi:hypothetical protein